MFSLHRSLNKMALADKEVAAACDRIALAVNLAVRVAPAAETSSVLDDLMLVRQRLHELTKENLILRYKLADPGFNSEQDLEEFRETIADALVKRTLRMDELQSRYDYAFFRLVYHPEFVKGACAFLVEMCNRYQYNTPYLWTALVGSDGMLTEELEERFKPKEVEIY